MKKYQVAVLFGGCSPEYGVSLQSAYAVVENMDKERFVPVMVGISREGSWYCFRGEPQKIKEDLWCNREDCVPAMLSPNRGSHRLLLLGEDGVEFLAVDIVFPVLHGKNGEDGTVQGLAELAGIPLAGCNTLSCALCMDKDRAHRLAQAAGVRVPKGMTFLRGFDRQELSAFANAVGYPVFVKPVRAGSSFGVTKVEEEGQLAQAVLRAFAYDGEVIVEEAVEGIEVGCAVLGTGELITGQVDEVELAGGFFDFTEKYTLQTSAIHVPARIDRQKAEEIKETAKVIYRALGCSVFARVDMFLTPAGEVVFNEVNTIPGFTKHSRYPGMMRAAHITFTQLLTRILELALEGGASE